MSTDNRALTGRALVKNFGNVHALAGVDIDIPSGQALAIMGPSGSGKSTLLHCLSYLSWSEGGRRLAVPPAPRALVPELPANENVALPLMLSDASRRTAISAADDWLRRLGLEDEANRRPGEMSGGQAQRVAIARATATDPQIIFADEPTASLDSLTAEAVVEELLQATTEQGRTLIMVTHDPAVASRCNHVAEIHDARIQGRPSQR